MKTAVTALAILGLIVQGTFIAVEKKRKYILAAALKGLASLTFVITGLLGYLSSRDASSLTILLGLAFGMMGDVILNLRYAFKKQGQKLFIAGTVVFFIGHICYLCSLIPRTGHLMLCAIIGLVLTIIFAFIIFKIIKVKTVIRLLGQFYVFAIFTMNILAFQIAAVSATEHNVLYAIGAMLFACSDIILIINTFGKRPNARVRVFYLYIYYIGQTLIALSIFFS